MAARFLNKYTVLLTLQKRLDASEVTLYEAVLGLFALQRLFRVTGQVDVLSDADQLWALSVYERLRAIIEGREPTVDENEVWMNIWLTHSGADLLVAHKASAELLESARGGGGHGLRKISSPRETAGGTGEDPGEPHAAEHRTDD